MKAIERRIKREIYASQHAALLRPAPGWTQVAMREVEAVAQNWSLPGSSALQISVDENGELTLEGLDFRHLIELPLRLFTVSDVLWLLQSRHVGSFGELIDFWHKIPWELYLPPHAVLNLRVESYRSRLFHEGKITELLTQELQSKGFRVAGEEATFKLLSLQRENRHHLYFSLVGPEPLFHRRYKAARAHRAPLQEHLAASAIRWFESLQEATWRPDLLAIPFAGSGTFLGEYLLFHEHMMPFSFREDYAITQSPSLPRASWEQIKKRRYAARLPAQGYQVQLIERDPEQIKALHIFWQGLSDQVGRLNTHTDSEREPTELLQQDSRPKHLPPCMIMEGDAFQFSLPHSVRSILMPLNPPYGQRLSQGGDLDSHRYYQRLGRWLKALPQAQQELRGFVLVPDVASLEALSQTLGRASVQGVQSFTQGGQHIRCLAFSLGTVHKGDSC